MYEELRRNGVLYLRRWRVLRTALLSIYVHNIVAADPELRMHTHPCLCVSFKLRDSYTEQTPEGERVAPRLGRVPYKHRIVKLHGSVWSIFFMIGPRRPWGFE